MIDKSILEQVAKETIVAFHLGRGGHFWNPGHKTFIGENPIEHYVDDLFLFYGNQSEIWEKIQGRPNLEAMFERATCDEDGEALAFFEKIGLPFSEKEYFKASGSPVCLTESEAETGIGCINIDNEYNTTFTKLLSDCDEQELKLIRGSLYGAAEEYIEWMLLEEAD